MVYVVIIKLSRNAYIHDSKKLLSKYSEEEKGDFELELIFI